MKSDIHLICWVCTNYTVISIYKLSDIGRGPTDHILL